MPTHTDGGPLPNVGLLHATLPPPLLPGLAPPTKRQTIWESRFVALKIRTSRCSACSAQCFDKLVKLIFNAAVAKNERHRLNEC